MTRWLAAVVVVLGAVPAAAGGGAPQTPAPASSEMAGPWTGRIDVGGTTIPFSVVFAPVTNGPMATMDIQGAHGLPLRAVRAANDAVHFELAAGPGLAVFDGTRTGDTVTGTFQQGPARGTFTMARGPAAPAPATAPTGPPPPYHVEDVTFTNGGVSLAGTLTIPEGTGPFPAVVMVTGSGAQNRDEELFGFRIFGVIADHLTRHGIAVLRYDDRGVGGSTGSIAASTTADFAKDALAGVTLLGSRLEIDKARIGVLGHSDGADAAAIAAAQSSSVAFIVMLAGPALPGETILARQQADGARQLGATDADIAAEQAAFHRVAAAIRSDAGANELTETVRAMLAAQYQARSASGRAALGDRTAFVQKALPAALAQISAPWMRYTITFDPAPVLADVHCPVLALFGGKDTQVPPDINRPALEAALRQNPAVTVTVYPEANHLFIPAKTGQVSEYPTLPKHFVDGLLDQITTWILAVK